MSINPKSISLIVSGLTLIVVVVGLFSKAEVKPDIQKNIATEALANTEVKETKEEKRIVNFSNKKVVIDVPYVSEAPEGNWSGDWINACEEATITMVDEYYKGVKYVSVESAKNSLKYLFEEENKLFGSNKNTNAVQMKELIDLFSGFHAEIIKNPTIDDIKKEIDNRRPVISLHRGFDLNNVNIPFSPSLSSYHTIVVVGYVEAKKSFIAHDPGDDLTGEYIYYSYVTFFNSLHDYNAERNETSGTPTVLFTNIK